MAVSARAAWSKPSGGLPSIILAPEDFPGPASLQVASADAQCSQDDSTDDLPIRPLTRPSIRATAGSKRTAPEDCDAGASEAQGPSKVSKRVKGGPCIWCDCTSATRWHHCAPKKLTEGKTVDCELCEPDWKKFNEGRLEISPLLKKLSVHVPGRQSRRAGLDVEIAGATQCEVDDADFQPPPGRHSNQVPQRTVATRGLLATSRPTLDCEKQTGEGLGFRYRKQAGAGTLPDALPSGPARLSQRPALSIGASASLLQPVHAREQEADRVRICDLEGRLAVLSETLAQKEADLADKSKQLETATGEKVSLQQQISTAKQSYIQEGEYAQAQLLTARQELAQEKKGRQEWEEARKQAAAAENMQQQHDADARLLAAQQEHVTFMKDAELWNQLEASMAEEFHMQDASLHYEARLRESKQLHRSQLADSEECRIHTLAAQQREHDSLLQVLEERDAVLKARVEELEGMLGPVFNLVHDNRVQTHDRQDAVDRLMNSGPEGYATLLHLYGSWMHNAMILELMKREETVKALTSQIENLETALRSRNSQIRSIARVRGQQLP